MHDEQLTAAKEKLKDFPHRKEFLVAIDSDGCVFDSMNPKQIVVFHPRIMDLYGLWGIESYLREVAEFVNLFSDTRGCNRFLALHYVCRFLKERGEVGGAIKKQGICFPNTDALDGYVETYKDRSLGNPSQEEYIQETQDESLSRLLGWSVAINSSIARKIKDIPSFDHAKKALSFICQYADVVVVSQTPHEALVREWEEHGLNRYVGAIAGQEMGSKEYHIRIASAGRYQDDKTMMIGDAPGDRRAADANCSLFYPIVPGKENESWLRLVEVGFSRFFDGTFAGEYQERLLAEFEGALSSSVPWREQGYDHEASYKRRQELREALYRRFDPDGRLLVLEESE